jgi:hypothetical protein
MGRMVEGSSSYDGTYILNNTLKDALLEKEQKQKEKLELRKKKIKELKSFSFKYYFYKLWKKIL